MKRICFFMIMFVFLIMPFGVEATDKNICTYTSGNGDSYTVSVGKGIYADQMRSKIYINYFKGKYKNKKEVYDENRTSLAYQQASGVCPQGVMVVKKGWSYYAYSGSEEAAEQWRKNNYPDQEYEYSKLLGPDTGVIDRMNYTNTKDYHWFQYAEKLDCSYNKGQTKVTLYGNYLNAVKQLGQENASVCPSHIYQYCTTSNPDYCAYSFFPEKQYLCDYNDYICKKIDVNGVTNIEDSGDGGESGADPEVGPDAKKNATLYKTLGGDDVPEELGIVVERKSGNISTVLSMSGGKSAALVGTTVSKKWLNSILNDETKFTSVRCLSYDDFINHRMEKYVYDTNFSNGELNSYQYVCALKTEEQIVWSSSPFAEAAKYDINAVDDMKLFNYYDRLTALDKFSDCTNLEGDEKKDCLAAQNTLYDESLKVYDVCKKSLANMDYKCEPATSIDKCLDNCCVCNELYKIIQQYADDGYFGNRIIIDPTPGACDDTLGSLGVWLTRIYKIMLFAIPVIIVIMGFKDFIQAFTAGKEDELKKCGSIFIKRLILGAIFVALPMLIKVILTIALGGDLANICIL